jgi:hypothetical protein
VEAITWDLENQIIIMYLDLYKIDNTVNLDTNPCFSNSVTYPSFHEDLLRFKDLLKILVQKKETKTFYKFGDGDYFFLKKQAVGSATPGRRALGKDYSSIDHSQFTDGVKKNDFYSCEIYPENRKMFTEVIPDYKIDFPAEFVYGLIANKWILENFSGKIGIIGADRKIELIRTLLEYKEYQDYLRLSEFNDYISIPQKFACDDLERTENIISQQLKNSKSDIFILGIGHVKSGLLHRLKKHKNAIYLDIGSGVDAIAGIIDVERPFFGDWINFQINGSPIYNEIDYLAYTKKGKHVYL